jgi:hypothetical protein
VLLAFSNLESTPTRATGLYTWRDANADGLLDTGDTLRLLGVLEGVSTASLAAGDFILF